MLLAPVANWKKWTFRDLLRCWETVPFVNALRCKKWILRKETWRCLEHRPLRDVPNCKQSAFLPNVERIESETFRECDSSLVMKFQNGLRCVADNVFYWCRNLQAVALPKSITVICRSAFEVYPKLVSVELGDGPITMTIYDECLFGMHILSKHLSSFRIPNNPTKSWRFPVLRCWN